MTRPLDTLRDELAVGLAARRKAGRYRSLTGAQGIDLTSNDYLGYSRHPELVARVAAATTRHGVGAGASRLLRGHSELLAEAEWALAAFSGRSSSLLFPSGYHANLGVIPSLVGRGDTVFSDAANHASLIDAIRLSRADVVITPHGDLGVLAQRLADAPRAGRRLIVTESVYSMDGDFAPLDAICELAEERDALVFVDEAHATGLYGLRGSGRVEALGLTDRVVCSVHTGGKALGVGGAWVAGDRVLIEHLLNHARTFVYTTAPVPAIPAGLLAALDRRARDHGRVEALHETGAWFRQTLRAGGLDLLDSTSLIVPVVLVTEDRALEVAEVACEAGFDVRAIRPPTVPEGSSRLRLTVREPVARADLARLADLLIAEAGV